MPRTLCIAALGAAVAFVAPCAVGAQRGAAGTPLRADSLPLSIEEAVVRALRTGEEARLAATQVEITEAQVSVSRASIFPQLRLVATYNHVIENARAQAVGQIFNQPNTYNSNANLSQTIFQGGREFAGPRVASRTRAAARLTAAETRAQVSLDVQRAYLDALFIDRLVDIRATGFELASARLRQVEQFQTAGRAARYDVLRARVERANFEPLVIQARDDRELAVLELKRLANIPADQPLRLTSRLDSTSVPALLASFASAAADSLDDGGTRPSVRAAELLVQARRSGVTVARADLLPTISVFIQSGFQAFPQHGFPTDRGVASVIPCPTDPVQPGCRPTAVQNGGWFADRTVGATVAWPIFDGLRTRGNIDLARAQARLAEIQLRQEREEVALEVARARAGLERARALYTAQRQNAAEATEAFSLASLRFTRGLGTQLETSDAQLALLTAQTNEARTVYDLYLASAELARALGRPIPTPPGIVPARTTNSTSGSSGASHR